MNSLQRRPRVVLAIESLNPGNGGIARVARLIAKVLGGVQKAGDIFADAVTLSDHNPVTDLGLPVEIMRGSRLRFVLAVQRRSLTHTHFIYDFLGMARAHCILPVLRKPFLVGIMGVEMWAGARSVRLQWARRADKLWCISNYTKMRVNEVFGGFDSAPVCWLATESDAEPLTMAKFCWPPTVTIVARLDEGGGYKGHKELIQCWRQVVNAVPEAKLLIVGRGPGYEAVREWVMNSPVSSRIEMKGFIPEEKMKEVWQSTWVLAMPSRGEGFGLVYIEAMRYGIPVIASIHDAGAEVNVDSNTGFNVNLDDEEMLPARIITLLQNQEQARQMGLNGLNHWREHFKYSVFRKRFLPILYQFINMGK